MADILIYAGAGKATIEVGDCAACPVAETSPVTRLPRAGDVSITQVTPIKRALKNAERSDNTSAEQIQPFVNHTWPLVTAANASFFHRMTQMRALVLDQPFRNAASNFG